MTGGPWVIDASFLAKLYLRDEEFAHVAREVVRAYVGGMEELVALEFILYEIPSAIQAAVRRQRLSDRQGREAVRDLFALGIRTVGGTDQALVEAAYDRAQQLGCSIYDALYVVVAETLGFDLLTADRKLYDAVHESVPCVVSLGDLERQADARPE